MIKKKICVYSVSNLLGIFKGWIITKGVKKRRKRSRQLSCYSYWLKTCSWTDDVWNVGWPVCPVLEHVLLNLAFFQIIWRMNPSHVYQLPLDIVGKLLLYNSLNLRRRSSKTLKFGGNLVKVKSRAFLGKSNQNTNF